MCHITQHTIAHKYDNHNYIQLVEVKLNPYKIISHYCNNKFALQYAHIHNLCLDFKYN
jgi:hypothetical protein